MVIIRKRNGVEIRTTWKNTIKRIPFGQLHTTIPTIQTKQDLEAWANGLSQVVKTRNNPEYDRETRRKLLSIIKIFEQRNSNAWNIYIAKKDTDPYTREVFETELLDNQHYLENNKAEILKVFNTPQPPNWEQEEK